MTEIRTDLPVVSPEPEPPESIDDLLKGKKLTSDLVQQLEHWRMVAGVSSVLLVLCLLVFLSTVVLGQGETGHIRQLLVDQVNETHRLKQDLELADLNHRLVVNERDRICESRNSWRDLAEWLIKTHPLFVRKARGEREMDDMLNAQIRMMEDNQKLNDQILRRLLQPRDAQEVLGK